jgi:hypothetical protein
MQGHSRLAPGWTRSCSIRFTIAVSGDKWIYVRSRTLLVNRRLAWPMSPRVVLKPLLEQIYQIGRQIARYDTLLEQTLAARYALLHRAQRLFQRMRMEARFKRTTNRERNLISG